MNGYNSRIDTSEVGISSLKKTTRRKHRKTERIENTGKWIGKNI